MTADFSAPAGRGLPPGVAKPPAPPSCREDEIRATVRRWLEAHSAVPERSIRIFMRDGAAELVWVHQDGTNHVVARLEDGERR